MGKMNQDCKHQTKQLTSAIGGLQVMSRLQMGGQEVYCPQRKREDLVLPMAAATGQIELGKLRPHSEKVR